MWEVVKVAQAYDGDLEQLAKRSISVAGSHGPGSSRQPPTPSVFRTRSAIGSQTQNLPDHLNEAATAISRELEETVDRTLSRLHEIAQQSDAHTTEARLRLSEQQHMLVVTERNPAHMVEMLPRQAEHVEWTQTGLVVLAPVAGILGKAAEGLLILGWMLRSVPSTASTSVSSWNELATRRATISTERACT